MTTIHVNPDGTVAVHSSRGLAGMLASSDATHANALDVAALVAVLVAVKSCPFPLGNGEAVYRECLAAVQAGTYADAVAKANDAGIGKLRTVIVHRAMHGCNAPHDSYLRIAYGVATGAEYIRRY